MTLTLFVATLKASNSTTGFGASVQQERGVRREMSKKQLLALFVCSLVPWTVGNGLLPLLPVYATQLGADPKTAGNYLAFSYVAIAFGSISAGWISDGFQRRKISLIIVSLAGIPVCWLMGRAGSILILSGFLIK